MVIIRNGDTKNMLICTEKYYPKLHMFKAEKTPICVECSHRGGDTAQKILRYFSDEKEYHLGHGQIPF